jgi:2-dehydro-3-deoxyglucarate aldolase/4-hydroxy-2-oxoheptanedioate aldolase
MNERINRAALFLKDIGEGKCKIGGHTFFLDPAITEALALYGYDYIWIDGEHSPFSGEAVLSHIHAAAAGGAAAFVRVPWNDPVLLKPILEMNPDGIIIPLVSTAEEAAKAAAACRYPPNGIRGIGPRRANNYGNMDFNTYLGAVEKSFLTIIQIEQEKAVNNIDSIITVEGIDAVILGPMDLSASMGLIGNIKHEKVVAACDRVINACKTKAMPCGISIGPGDLDYFKSWIAKGINFISCGDDISFLQMGARRVLEYARNSN